LKSKKTDGKTIIYPLRCVGLFRTTDLIESISGDWTERTSSFTIRLAERAFKLRGRATAT